MEILHRGALAHPPDWLCWRQNAESVCASCPRRVTAKLGAVCRRTQAATVKLPPTPVWTTGFFVVIPESLAGYLIKLDAQEARYIPLGAGKLSGGWLLTGATPPELPEWNQPEILQMLQEYQFGYYPDHSQEKVEATRSGTTVNIAVLSMDMLPGDTASSPDAKKVDSRRLITNPRPSSLRPNLPLFNSTAKPACSFSSGRSDSKTSAS